MGSTFACIPVDFRQEIPKCNLLSYSSIVDLELALHFHDVLVETFSLYLRNVRQNVVHIICVKKWIALCNFEATKLYFPNIPWVLTSPEPNIYLQAPGANKFERTYSDRKKVWSPSLFSKVWYIHIILTIDLLQLFI